MDEMKFDSSHSGATLILRTATDTLALDASALDETIVALCAERQRRDPEGYSDFALGKLFPAIDVSPGYTAVEMLRRVHAATGKFASASVDSAGRTTLTIGEMVSMRETTLRDGEALHLVSDLRESDD